MGRGHWTPPCAEACAACDGFYVDCDAVYKGDVETGWEEFLTRFCRRMSGKDHSLQRVCDWKNYSIGENLFVVVQNHQIEIVAEESDGLLAVYALIPEGCPKPGMAKRSFPRYLEQVYSTLTELYPGSVRKRINSQHIRLVG